MIKQDIYCTAPQVSSATNSLFTPPRRSSPYLRILFMVAPNPLQQLHDLDRSSSQFHDQLSGLLREEEFRNFVSSPQSEGLGQLVEYLDNVLVDISDLISHAFQEFLHELGKICGAREMLPKSCTLSNSLLKIDPPTTSGHVREGTLDGSKVFIKRSRINPKEDLQKVKETFSQVAVLWKHSSHPSIVPLLGATISTLQLVVEWMPGGDLTGYIRNHPDADRIGLLSDTTEGLNYLHSCNVIHGDLKGSNILITTIGRARITDFGLVTVTKNPDHRWSALADLERTVRWTAPEILNGQGTYSKEADVFSFAMVTIEAFTHAVPFDDNPIYTVILEIEDGKRPPRPTHPTFTDRLWVLTQRCWDQEAHRRPQVPEVLQVLYNSGPPTWKRLITHPLTIHERTSLITAIFSDRSEIEVVRHLCGSDAQSFIDAIDEVLNSLTPRIQRKCLKTLCKLCGRQSLLPRSLQVPLFYDQSDTPLYRGGCADVWRGQYQGSSVAVKVLRVYSTSDFDKVISRFCKEVMAWKTLRHPNVLPLLGATMSDRKFAMTSEWMVNGNINEFIKAHKDADRFELLKGVAKGLIYLHDQAMIHGDLKGANIVIDQDGHARLADFGLLIIVSDPTNPTVSTSVAPAGTTRWMSPELLDPDNFGSKDSRPTKESDCYAFGMVVYEVLSGKAPFTPYRDFVVMRKIIEGERPERPQGTEGEWFTDYLWDTLQLCWKHQPGERPTVKVVLGYLERISLWTDDRMDDTPRAVSPSSPTFSPSTAVAPLPSTRKRRMDDGVDSPPRVVVPNSPTFSPSTVVTPPPTKKRRRSGSDPQMPSSSDSQRIPDTPMRPAGLELDIVLHLVGLFFSHCHPARMIIHKPSFMSALNQNIVAPHLILAICAMSAPFSQSSQVKSHLPRLEGLKFYVDALNILFDASGRLICEANLQTVQTLCLLEMHDVVAQHSWTKSYQYLDIATEVLFETLDIASPESLALSQKPSIQEMTRTTERECARRCYWIIYFLHALSTAWTRNTRRFSAENKFMQLPTDETSFEFGVQSPNPEHLDETAPGTRSEFGHLIRITALFSQMGDAIAIVDDDDLFTSAMQEAEKALKAWEDSLPEYLQYTEDNLRIMNSVLETTANTGPWCFFYMHALHSCCEMSAPLEVQKRFSSANSIVPKQASNARDRCLRILKSVGSRVGNMYYLVAPSLWIISRYFKDNPTMITVDDDFETVWGWRVCEISETWRKHNEARKLKPGRSQKSITAGGSLGKTIGRHLSELKIRGPSAARPSSIVPADDVDNFYSPWAPGHPGYGWAGPPV